jgi:hydroxypyruvate reductase/glycerate 2-kinase
MENTSEKYKPVRRDALEILDEVLKKMSGYNIVKQNVKIEDNTLYIKDKKIDLSSFKKKYLIGFGKASSSMAEAMVELMEYDDGVVLGIENKNLKNVKLFAGTHPFPSKKNIMYTEKLIKLVDNTTNNDLIICLISGGGSSFLCHPRIALKNMVMITKALMEKGCKIEELNTVRKHLSFVKGGQLTQRTDAKIISLIISDIIDNPIEFIASGPTYFDSTTYSDALKILGKYNIYNAEASTVLNSGVMGKITETPKKIKNAQHYIIADIETACKLVKKFAQRKKYHAKIISTKIQGEAKDVGKNLI